MSTTSQKIKLIREAFATMSRSAEEFWKLDKESKDSETYLNLSIKEFVDEYETAKKLHAEVICSDDDDEIQRYRDKGYLPLIQKIYLQHSTKLHDLLKIIMQERQETTFLEMSHSNIGRINLQTAANHMDYIPMPVINITPFTGNYDKWQEFRDDFISAVHNNASYNDNIKLKLLQNVLKGDALKVVKREFGTLKAGDYENIWKKLLDRYNHKRSLINSYFSSLFFQPMIEKESSQNLKLIYDTSVDAVMSLKNLGLPTDGWSDILLYLVHSKLPIKTKEIWDEKLGNDYSENDLPTFSDFLSFLEKRFRTLESLEETRRVSHNFNTKNISTNQKQPNYNRSYKNATTLTTNQAKKPSIVCKHCKETGHFINKCTKFLENSVENRRKLVQTLNLCFNCLGFSHRVVDCPSKGRCITCRQKHHSVLHVDRHDAVAGPSNEATTLIAHQFNNVIFPTAIVKAKNSLGVEINLRVLIDSCSDASYITTEAINSLQLSVTKTDIQTNGLGDVATAKCHAVTSIKLRSALNKFEFRVRAFVIENISSNRPVQSFKISHHNKGISLADHNFNIHAPIDMLLGGDIAASLEMPGFLKSDDGNLIYKESKLGWLVKGIVNTSQCFMTSTDESKALTLEQIDKTLRKFWEVEEVLNFRSLTEEEHFAESFYEKTTKRLGLGQYIVSLPFRKEIKEFKNMREIAHKRFLGLERRLCNNPTLRKEYVNCLQEYIDLGHMSKVDPNDFPNAYYIPHHCVIKESSSTTKVRVVFDASTQDLNKTSLNDNLLNGPRLQRDLSELVTKFRMYRIGFTADIAQMYRQVLVSENDRKFQLILWRNNPSSPIETFVLNTVTFGTTSAPYLAIKTLYRLAEDEKERFPIGSACLQNAFYVDDFIFGSDTLDEAMEITRQTKDILQSAGLNLRKWSTNSIELLEQFPEDDRETKILTSFESQDSIKTLGIHWCPRDDSFHFDIKLADHKKHTKRTVLSDIAKIFDPLGWVSPSIVLAKLFIQELWLTQNDWDTPLSNDQAKTWKELRNNLPILGEITINRWLGTLKDSEIELHGFSDASEKAYGACIYVRTNKSVVNLLFSKSKVAPLQKISLPRLELTAATLLAKMIFQTRELLNVSESNCYCWSDSMITLAWIKDKPYKRTTYVANRITEIQKFTKPSIWNHVKSKDNPADLVSRGVLPSDLKNNMLWWSGPQFLLSFENTVEFRVDHDIELPIEENKRETKTLSTFLTSRKVCLLETTANYINFSMEQLNKFSSLTKLINVVAYCLRFIKRTRSKELHITPSEYDNALVTVLRIAQGEFYSEEYKSLEQGNILKKGPISNLNPFINESDKLLRVKSRLENAEHISFDQIYPIILPYNHFITTLIVRRAHISTLHGTRQQTLMLVNQRYHIVRGNSLVKTIINNCVVCYRHRTRKEFQLMGQLPKTRVTPERPFANCAVDFAGPFELKRFRGKCNSFIKAYFAIFVCFTTKAIHLEVVEDLSTTAFVDAYRRFVARRGLVKNLYSDCGTNFMGAQKFICKSITECKAWSDEIAKEMSQFKTNWHFNPPGSPHFGGLVEAGVKTVKYHLKRIVKHHLTYVEFETILLQVESCLNSRPICQIKDDPNNIVLTPGHFLVQDSLLALPYENLESRNLSISDRWNYLQKIVQNFWQIWSQDYLNTLRQRQKWRQCKENLKIGDVVLVQEPKLPPNQWLLGQIVETHRGKDNLVRVVSVKTKNNIIKRSIVKVSPLPINEN